MAAKEKKKKQSGGRKIATDALPYSFFVRSFVRGDALSALADFGALYTYGAISNRDQSRLIQS
jgi:hypothetical protein